MIRIAHVITDTNFGGAGRVLLNVLKNFDRGRFEMTVILPHGSVLEPEVRLLGCDVISAKKIVDRSFSVPAIFELRRILKGLQPDIVHTHACMSARIAARMSLTGCRVIFTRHCAFDVAAYKKRFPYKLFSGFVNNYFSDRVIAVSPVSRDVLIDIGTDPDKINVVMNGSDPVGSLPEQERLSIRGLYGIGRNDFVCVMAARLEKVKGHKYAIEAFKALPNDVKLVIAGEGSEDEYLRTAANGMDNCIFTGFVKEIEKIENIADLMLNLSDTEATCAALLEGMSLGIPAVVSNFGGNSYVVR